MVRFFGRFVPGFSRTQEQTRDPGRSFWNVVSFKGHSAREFSKGTSDLVSIVSQTLDVGQYINTVHYHFNRHRFRMSRRSHSSSDAKNEGVLMRAVPSVSQRDPTSDEHHSVSNFRNTTQEQVGGFFTGWASNSGKQDVLMASLKTIQNEIQRLQKDAEKYKPGSEIADRRKMTVVAAQLKRWHDRLDDATALLTEIQTMLNSTSSKENLNAMTGG